MRFRRSVFLPAPSAAVYAFHEDLRNITAVMPAGTRVKTIRGKRRAKAGDRFFLEVSQFLLPLRWHGQWEVAERPHRLVDVSATFPFTRWRHEHRFDPRPGGTCMTDQVEYQVPWYLGGALTAGTFFRVLFHAMFNVRHRRTREYFAKSGK